VYDGTPGMVSGSGRRCLGRRWPIGGLVITTVAAVLVVVTVPVLSVIVVRGIVRVLLSVL